MAARENQGLQIAVMIFFLLVVLLAVTTYVFFKGQDDLSKQVAALEAENLTAKQNGLKYIEEGKELKKLLGFAPEVPLGTVDAPEPDSILAKFKDDMDTYGANIDPKTYHDVLQKLHETLVSSEDSAVKAKEVEQQAVAQFKDVESTKQQQVDSFRAAAEKAATDYEAATGEFTGSLAELEKTKGMLSGQLEAKRVEGEDKITAANQQITDLGNQVQKLSNIVKSQQARKEAIENSTSESPDGTVTWVNQRSRVVWIDLGGDDNLARQTIFSVYPVDATNAPILSQKKGSIEVTRVLDRHMAEAKIIDDEVADPFLPGDVIMSPVWDRGRVDGFALAGFMDIDKDGKSDRAKIREMIKLNGGRVDAEVDDDGKLIGKIELTTRYIVLGKAPDDKIKNQDLLDNFSVLTGEAAELSIEKISIEKFVQQLGWQPEERTVPLGKGARPDDFLPRPEGGVQQKSTGNTSDTFKKRATPRRTTF